MSKNYTPSVTAEMVRRANERIMSRQGACSDRPSVVYFLGQPINVAAKFDREKLYAAIERVNERKAR